jgi:hypothetical protein
VLRKEKLTYFDGNLTEYEREQRRAFRLATRQQEVLDKKKEAVRCVARRPVPVLTLLCRVAQVEKTIEQATRVAKQTGDDKKARLAKSRQEKLNSRWGLEQNAKGGRFKVGFDAVLGGCGGCVARAVARRGVRLTRASRPRHPAWSALCYTS